MDYAKVVDLAVGGRIVKRIAIGVGLLLITLYCSACGSSGGWQASLSLTPINFVDDNKKLDGEEDIAEQPPIRVVRRIGRQGS